MGVTVRRDVKVKPSGIGAGSGGPGGGDAGPLNPGPGELKTWPPGSTPSGDIEPQKYRIGMWVALASILMLFVSLTSAYIVRQVPALNGGQVDWVPLEMPPVLWVNTLALLASSATIELARRALRRDEY